MGVERLGLFLGATGFERGVSGLEEGVVVLVVGGGYDEEVVLEPQFRPYMTLVALGDVDVRGRREPVGGHAAVRRSGKRSRRGDPDDGAADPL